MYIIALLVKVPLLFLSYDTHTKISEYKQARNGGGNGDSNSDEAFTSQGKNLRSSGRAGGGGDNNYYNNNVSYDPAQQERGSRNSSSGKRQAPGAVGINDVEMVMVGSPGHR